MPIIFANMYPLSKNFSKNKKVNGRNEKPKIKIKIAQINK